jgi:osmotically inducible protein OsmC
MATFSRNATVNWQGSLMEGGGEAVAGTGAFKLPVSFPRRVGDAQGTTSPEELIAAAHASCYAMVLAAASGRKGASMSKAHVTCTVTADKGDAGIKIMSSRLAVTVEGLQGLEASAFDAFAKDAEKGCPVSNALRGTVAIEVQTTVK